MQEIRIKTEFVHVSFFIFTRLRRSINGIVKTLPHDVPLPTIRYILVLISAAPL